VNGQEIKNKNELTRTHFTVEDVFRTLACAVEFEQVLDCILMIALRELDADEGSILLLTGPDATELKMLASRGLPEEMKARGYVPRAGSISERVLTEKKGIIVNGTLKSSSNCESLQDLKPRNIVSAICVPLATQGKLIGTMNINRTREGSHPFENRDLRLAEIIAGQAAMVIENHRLQDQLREQERLAAVGQVVTGIAHCVKNLLAGVQGGMGLIEMGAQTENCGLVTQGTQILKRSVTILSSLILDLLDWSKERKPLRQEFAAQSLLETLQDLISWKAEQQGISFVTECAHDFTLWADRDQLTRALLNLVTNAIDACTSKAYSGDESPHVKIKAELAHADDLPLSPPEQQKSKKWAVFEVSDNGCGISPEHLPHLWDLFFSTKGSKGTGIGLPAVRKVVSEHEGKILLDSEVGKGSRFTILLPAWQFGDSTE